MHPAPIPADDASRLRSLQRYDILDTEPEEVFDRITRIASKVAGVPIALVSLVAEDRQWFKSRVGLDATETGRDISFCGHAILAEAPLIVEDALADQRFHDNPLVTGAPGIRFYMGVPLEVSDGAKIGTLCVIDQKPRKLDHSQKQTLVDLASIAVRELEYRKVALSDPLTGAFNRRLLDRLVRAEIGRLRRGDKPFCFVAIDLDHFKGINDTHGHDAGDVVLIRTAQVCRDLLRAQDTLFRQGGEEFGLLLPGTTLDEGLAAAERVRTAVAGQSISLGDKVLRVTASLGVTQGLVDDEPDDILRRADQALYRAKRDGRNRVIPA